MDEYGRFRSWEVLRYTPKNWLYILLNELKANQKEKEREKKNGDPFLHFASNVSTVDLFLPFSFNFFYLFFFFFEKGKRRKYKLLCEPFIWAVTCIIMWPGSRPLPEYSTIVMCWCVYEQNDCVLNRETMLKSKRHAYHCLLCHMMTYVDMGHGNILPKCSTVGEQLFQRYTCYCVVYRGKWSCLTYVLWNAVAMYTIPVIQLYILIVGCMVTVWLYYIYITHRVFGFFFSAHHNL